MGDRVTVRVASVVIQHIRVDNADIEDEDIIVDDARDDAEFKLEEKGFHVEDSQTLVKWEHD